MALDEEDAPQDDTLEGLKAELTIAETMAAMKLVEKLDLEIRDLQREEEETLTGNARRRVYHLTGTISDREYEVAVYNIGQWAALSNDPITVVLNSPGGYVHSGLALYDFLRGLSADGIHITTVGMGYVASMGGILLQAGDTRILSPNAWMLIHEVAGGAFGKSSEVEDEMKFVKRQQAQCLNILASRAKMKKADIAKKWKRKDWWLQADECIRHGFADKVSEGWSLKK
jgi:ATP-dependent Clp endopeptidase proteolytic subunit ClpP